VSRNACKKQLGSAGSLPAQVAVKPVRGITTTTERATLSVAMSETNAAVPDNKKAAQKCGSLQIPIWWRRGELDSLRPLIVRNLLIQNSKNLSNSSIQK
jgi:hypothetical protein